MADTITNPTNPLIPETESALPEGWLQVKSLDLEAQGVAHKPDGKVVFIEGALPFEIVRARIHRSKGSFEKGA
ncbi:MAG: 23S rRNA (uracil(1939)-C(5))-methyltransferase, partial [Rhodoferax sp.]|nr:23S rRNA (uracil(1939)-C(5))-methyltransferase [Rhodoferax sp.]